VPAADQVAGTLFTIDPHSRLESANLPDESKASYAIVRYNLRTYESGGVMAVVKGRDSAEATMKRLEQEQSSADRHEGWRYFIEKTDLKPGMDPQEATKLRQMRLDIRESQP
jgi:hypothetical protein